MEEMLPILADQGITVLTGRVSGGARGIGLAIAKAVAELGSDVALFDMIEPQESLAGLTERYGRRFQFYRLAEFPRVFLLISGC